MIHRKIYQSRTSEGLLFSSKHEGCIRASQVNQLGEAFEDTAFKPEFEVVKD
jgi:hypothetical protein